MRGGSRPGAGRPRGAATKRTREIADRAVADGVLPIEYMLGVMRDPAAEPSRRDEMAKAAAPYLHPRLSAVAYSGPEGGPIEMSIEERRAKVRQSLDEAFGSSTEPESDKTDAAPVAASSPLDRGRGKPTQPISVDQDAPPIEVPVEDKRAIAMAILAGHSAR